MSGIGDNNDNNKTHCYLELDFRSLSLNVVETFWDHVRTYSTVSNHTVSYECLVDLKFKFVGQTFVR